MAKSLIRVAIYIRVSTLDQVDGYSLETQERDLRKWCADQKCEVYNLYADRGISGKDITHRPDMLRLMRDAEAGCFDRVLVWALSRFTRSVRDLYDTMTRLGHWGIDMVSYTESFDTTSPAGRAMIGIIGVFAQLERELTGERVRAAMATRAAQGKRTCGDVLGYDKAGKDNLKINPKEAEYVTFIFDEYEKRKNLVEVAELCRQRGYHGKRGRTPSAWSISVILTRPIYCGYNSFRGQLYRGMHEPIITAAQFKRVQTLLKRQGRAYGRI